MKNYLSCTILTLYSIGCMIIAGSWFWTVTTRSVIYTGTFLDTLGSWAAFLMFTMIVPTVAIGIYTRRWTWLVSPAILLCCWLIGPSIEMEREPYGWRAVIEIIVSAGWFLLSMIPLLLGLIEILQSRNTRQTLGCGQPHINTEDGIARLHS